MRSEDVIFHAPLMDVLSRSFYNQDTLRVARALLGCFFVRQIGRKIIRARNGADVTQKKHLWIERGDAVESKDICADKRIGIDYALHCKEYLWRFMLKNKK